MSDPEIFSIFKDELKTIEEFIRRNLELNLEREDYKELLYLSLLYLGLTPYENYKFRAPGAMHHARFMSKAIYSLKMFLFRDIIHLSKRDVVGIQKICIFIVKVYIRHWFEADQELCC